MISIIIFTLFVYIFWFPHIFQRILKHSYLWQIKEYRWDRMIAYVKESRSLSLKSKQTVVALLLFIGSAFLVRNMDKLWLYSVLIVGFSFFAFNSLDTFTNVFLKKITRPKRSIRNMIIVGGGVFISLAPLIISILFFGKYYEGPFIADDKVIPTGTSGIVPKELESGVIVIPLETISIVLFFLLLFLFDLLLPALVAGMVSVSSVFASFSRKRMIDQAKKKTASIENLKVIGITGSFGKSTTKRILYEILRKRFNTFATPKNVNTDLGVAQTVLKNLSGRTDVFIAEMGAYKIGEIKKICEIVQPDISIVTGINEQHIALFGDLENTLRAKYEIVEYSKPDALIVLNGDSDMVLRVAGKSRKKEILYSTKKELDLYASDIKSKDDRVEFNVHYDGETKRFEIRMLGEHNVSNILAATAAALQYGLTLEDIAKELSNISKTKRIGRLNIVKGKLGYRVIDDSYNANPAGFYAALDVLSKVKAKKKILVTIGILELGSKANTVYNQLSKRIVEVCDILVTTNEKLQKFVKEHDPKFRVVFDHGIEKQLQFLQNEVNNDDVVLFEGPNLQLTKIVLGKG